MAGSPGAQWTKALPLTGIRYSPKWASSAFVNPDLDRWLRAKACVAATLREALARGYEVELVADAIACGSDTSRARALARLQGSGARIVSARHYEPAF